MALNTLANVLLLLRPVTSRLGPLCVSVPVLKFYLSLKTESEDVFIAKLTLSLN